MKRVINKILKNDFTKDIGITTIGQLIAMFLTFVLNKVISIRLGPAQFTEYSLIHKTASVITYVMILSLGIALPRYLAIFREAKDRKKELVYVKTSLLITLVSTVVTFAVCIIFKETFASLLFGKDAKYIGFILPTLLLSLQIGVTTLLYSYYRGINDFIKYNASQCIVSVLLILSCFLDSDLLPIVYFMSGFGIVVSIIGFISIIRKYKKYSVGKSDIHESSKTLLKYSLPRVPGEFILFSFTLLPMVIINQRIGLERAAGYSAALGILTAVTPLYRYIGMVLLPYASKIVVNNDINAIENKIKKLSYVYIITSIIEIIAVLLFTKLVIIVIYSKKYVVYSNIVRVVSLSILPNSLYLLIRNPLDAISKKPINSINLLISFVIMMIFVYYSNTEFLYALSFFVGYLVLGILSFISWIVVKNRFKKRSNKVLEKC